PESGRAFGQGRGLTSVAPWSGSNEMMLSCSWRSVAQSCSVWAVIAATSRRDSSHAVSARCSNGEIGGVRSTGTPLPFDRNRRRERDRVSQPAKPRGYALTCMADGATLSRDASVRYGGGPRGALRRRFHLA